MAVKRRSKYKAVAHQDPISDPQERNGLVSEGPAGEEESCWGLFSEERGVLWFREGREDSYLMGGDWV